MSMKQKASADNINDPTDASIEGDFYWVNIPQISHILVTVVVVDAGQRHDNVEQGFLFHSMATDSSVAPTPEALCFIFSVVILAHFAVVKVAQK